jgi:hypothetical protein
MLLAETAEQMLQVLGSRVELLGGGLLVLYAVKLTLVDTGLLRRAAKGTCPAQVGCERLAKVEADVDNMERRLDEISGKLDDVLMAVRK